MNIICPTNVFLVLNQQSVERTVNIGARWGRIKVTRTDADYAIDNLHVSQLLSSLTAAQRRAEVLRLQTAFLQTIKGVCQSGVNHLQVAETIARGRHCTRFHNRQHSHCNTGRPGLVGSSTDNTGKTGGTLRHG